jgi:chemotaxis family two-component system response regulator Rcp1
MNILLVEDNPGDILLAKEALKETGLVDYRLNVVSDGEEALNFVFRRHNFGEALRPDLVLLDLNIPKINGREVLRSIKEDQDLRTIPIIVFSTSEAQHDINTSYELHANCYVTKPVDYDEFVTVITSIVQFWNQVRRVRTPVVS